MQRRDKFLPTRRLGWRHAFDYIGEAVFDAIDRKTAAAQDIGRLRRPRRNRAEPRYRPDIRGFCIVGRRAQDFTQPFAIQTGGLVGGDEIHVPRRNQLAAQVQAVQFAIDPLQAKRREGRKPIENDHGERISACSTEGCIF